MASKLTELGVTGLKRHGGRITEEWLRKLQGIAGRRLLREMLDNDDTVNTVLFAIEMLIRKVPWRVEPFSEDPLHIERAEFVETLIDDMSTTWEDWLSEVLTKLGWGFSVFEIVYKRRDGPGMRDPRRRSKHSDGRIGWRKFAPRAQETVYEWQFDDDGGLQGVVQLALETSPTKGSGQYEIPIEKLLLFRTTSRKGNPEGRSIFRGAFVSWHYKKHAQENEAIGIERDLAGLPVMWLPPGLFDDSNPNASTRRAEYQDIVENIRMDEQAGLLLPWIKDDDGNDLIKLELLGTGSRRIIDTDAVIQRYDRRIAQVALADFVMLGHEKVGSHALSSDKTTLFGTAIGAWVDAIADVLNRHAVPRLFELNGWSPAETPSFVPGDVEKQEIDRVAQALAVLTGAGWLAPGGEVDEDWARELLSMPARMDGAPVRSRPTDPDPQDGDGMDGGRAGVDSPPVESQSDSGAV